MLVCRKFILKVHCKFIFIFWVLTYFYSIMFNLDLTKNNILLSLGLKSFVSQAINRDRQIQKEFN
jgi:hypothetical protein